MGEIEITSTGPNSDRSTSIKLPGGLIISVLIAAVVIGVFWVFKFADDERQRDLRAWQVRLGIVADSRAEAVQSWIDSQLLTVGKLAENTSVRLYVSEVAIGDGDRDSAVEAAGQAGYLRNLLIATASRAGFDAPLLGPDVAANVERIGTAGLALIDGAGQILVATPAMPAMDRRLGAAMAAYTGGGPVALDLFEGAAGLPAMAFLAPVHGIQDDPDQTDALGFIFGVRLAGDDLYAALDQPGDVDQSAESYLVRRQGPTIEYLSPLADGSAALVLKLAVDTPDLAAAFAVDTPGGFARRVNYRNQQVLVTGRALEAVPWTLVRTIGEAEALGPSEARRDTMLIVFLLVIFAIAATILVVWRHGSSVRSAEAAARFQDMSKRFAALSKFLRVVADGQPTAIATVDADGRYSFANRKAARDAGIAESEIEGKAMVDVLGPARAGLYEPLNREALATQQSVFKTQTVPGPETNRIIRSAHIPLAADADRGAQVLMVLEDITEVVTERERRENNLRQLVGAIMSIIDRRDPYAARHSARVGEVAEAIAGEIGLTEVEIETAEIAGSLMNLGKILVPAEILTGTETLSTEDLGAVREAILSSADLLQAVEFDGPVIATMRQVYARWDGDGVPEGLAGEQILISARVVAVANSYVGMVSARSRRPGKTVDEAVDFLVAGVGKAFDRRPVAALVNVLDNRGGRERWASFAQAPADA